MNTERLRAEIAARLENAVGVPVHIEGATASLFPTAAVALRGIQIGDGAVRVEVDVCDIQVDLGRLLHREVHVTGARVRRARLHLPSSPGSAVEALGAQLDAIRAHQQQRSPAASTGISTAVDSVRVEGFHVLLGDTIIGAGDMHIGNVTAPDIGITLTTTLPEVGDSARVTSTLQLARRAGHPLALSGQAAFVVEEEMTLSETAAPFHIRAQAHVALSGPSLDNLAFTIAGDADIGYNDTITHGVMDECMVAARRFHCQRLSLAVAGLRADGRCHGAGERP